MKAMTTDSANAGTVPGLSNVVARFPVCLLASIVLCAVVNLRIAGMIDLDRAVEGRLVMGFVAMFLAGGIGHLFAEGRGWSRAQNRALAVGLAGLAGMAFVLQPLVSTEPLFLLPGLVLLLMVAGYSGPAEQQPGFWLFNARLAIAILVAGGVGLLFGAGLWAVLRSYGYLFPPGLDGRWEEHVWLTGITLVGPVAGLALIQGRLDDGFDPVGDRTLFGRVVSILAAWILVPIVIVNAVLLHAYAARTAWQGVLPDGEIGWMTLYFLVAGTATWLVVQPWAERGNRLLRWFAAAWLRLTIIPVVLLGAAVFQRIWAFGVLPERYGLALAAIWMLAVAAYAASIRGRPDPRVAVAGLGIALIVCAVGPWGARGLSVWTQTARLTGILETHGLIADGRLVDDAAARSGWDPATRQSAASIVAFLAEVDALDRLEPLLAGDSAGGAVTRDRIGVALGIGRTPDVATSMTFRANLPLDIPVATGTSLVGPLVSTTRGSDSAMGSVRSDGDRVIVSHGGSEWTVSARPVLDRAGTEGGGLLEGKPVALEAPGDPAATIVIAELSGRVGDRPTVSRVVVWLIVPDGQN
jgi:hypothetical protein